MNSADTDIVLVIILLSFTHLYVPKLSSVEHNKNVHMKDHTDFYYMDNIN